MSLIEADASIVEESAALLESLIAAARGELAFPEDDARRAYTAPPDLTAIRYIMDRALGRPGARVCEQEDRSQHSIYGLLKEIAAALRDPITEGALFAENGPFKAHANGALRRKSELLAKKRDAEQTVIAFLPTAIERLAELCAGVTVRKTSRRRGRPSAGEDAEAAVVYTDIQRKPDCRAIRYLMRRVAGDASVTATAEYLPPIQNDPIEPIETERPLKSWQREPLEKQERRIHTERVRISQLFEPQTAERVAEKRYQLPEYYAAAYVDLTSRLPAAIGNLKQLAAGAVTQVSAESGSFTVRHCPHPIAAMLLLNRVYGAPKAWINLPWSNPFADPNLGQNITTLTADIIQKCGDAAGEARELITGLIETCKHIYKPVCSAF